VRWVGKGWNAQKFPANGNFSVFPLSNLYQKVCGKTIVGGDLARYCFATAETTSGVNSPLETLPLPSRQ
jgi:hypothetical protein